MSADNIKSMKNFPACKELVFDCFIDNVIIIVLLEMSGLLLCLQQSSRIYRSVSLHRSRYGNVFGKIVTIFLSFVLDEK